MGVDDSAKSGAPDGPHVLRSRVVLREESGTEGPVVRPSTFDAAAAAASNERYQVAGEIARGGMGVVLRGRDSRLGRDVAMKVLREEYIERPDVVQRFVEEAQIGGQLQHPGIVPVYELGVQGERRPYFTMKLVKGRTLSALLAERRDPSVERRRFLAVFEAVCETVAYAHARGVLHRDLKPSNVMVGTFGEVQVMDWGLAKVLGHERPSEAQGSRGPTTHVSVVATVRSGSAGSQSLVGSVLGTPAYMPPEQARGEIETLDERSDVFSLGAILCEILTGRPPYTGADHDLVERAARADLADARARIASCGADPELVKICEACLSPARDARPANAHVVAEEITRHLSALETRARVARLAAVEATVVAATAGKSKRLAQAVVAAVLAAVAVAAVVTVVVVRAGTARAAAAEQRAARELGDAERLAQQARSSHDAALWKEALAAASRAREFARDVDADAQQRITAAVSALEADARGADAAAAARRRTDAAVARLDAARAALGERAPAADAEQFAAVLREAGVDPDADAQVAVPALRASHRQAEMLQALDILAVLRTQAGLPEGTAWRTASLADDDPLRAEIRGTRDAASLRALRSKLGNGPEPRTACLLADRLGAAGDAEAAVAILREARRSRMSDAWLHATCAYWERRTDPPDHAGAATSDTAALALRPDLTALWPRLADSICRSGDAPGGTVAAERAAEVAPASPLPPSSVGFALLAERDFRGAADAFRRSLDKDKAFAPAQEGLALALSGARDPAGALAAADAAVQSAPSSPECRMALARVQLARCELEAARAAALEAQRLGPRRADARVVRAECAWLAGDFEEMRRLVAEVRTLAPEDGPARALEALVLLLDHRLDGAHAAARSGLDRTPSDPWCRLALALVLDRREDALDADWRYLRAIESDPGFAEAHLRYADFLRRRGRLTDCARELRAALDATPNAPAWLRTRIESRAAVAARAQEIVPGVSGDLLPDRIRHGDDGGALATACAARGRGVRAARVRSEDAPADDAVTSIGTRCDAARALVTAALGWCFDGFILQEHELPSFLVRARGLLAADLDRFDADLEKQAAAARPEIREELRSWRTDAEFGRLADAAARGELPAGEPDAWAALWRRVDGVLARSQEAHGDGR